MPTAEIETIMDDVAGQINALVLADAGSSTISAAVQVPPIFDDYSVTCVKVFPDGDDVEASHSMANTYLPRVNVALCGQAPKDGASYRENLLLNRQLIVEEFVGNRLDSDTNIFCTGESTPSAVNLDELRERFAWISVITLEFRYLRARG